MYELYSDARIHITSMSELLYYAHISTFYWGGGCMELSHHKTEGTDNAALFVRLIHSCDSFLLLLSFA